MKKCTENYGSLAIDNKSQSYDINENLFWYKAPIYSKFKFGSEKYRKQHARKYNSKYEEESDSQIYGRRPNKPKIRIIRSYKGYGSD